MMKVLMEQFPSCPAETNWNTYLTSQIEQFSLSGPQQSKKIIWRKKKKMKLKIHVIANCVYSSFSQT